MTRADLLQRINELLSEIIDDDELHLEENMTADEVPGWDSINHMKLIIAIESEFNVRFEVDEISEMEDVGSLLDLIQSRLK